jgi:glycosyltransferase involved in cell wall biosynthesis
MRILHLDSGDELRGGQRQALALIEGLRERGIESLLLARRGSPLFDAAREAGLRVEPAGLGRVYAEASRFDLVHAHDAHSHTLAALVSLAARRPLIVSRRVDFPVKTGILSRWKYSRPVLFLAVSEAVGNRLLRAGVPQGKVCVVPDGVRLPASLGTLDGPVIAVNSDDPGKGRELIKRSHAPVHFTNDLPGLLPVARALVYISDSEGLGSAALLAMAHGVPVIGSRVGGLREIVIPHRTGLLVDNHTTQIATAVHMLLNDKDLALQLGRAGRDLVSSRYTLQNMIDATLDAYRKVLA